MSLGLHLFITTVLAFVLTRTSPANCMYAGPGGSVPWVFIPLLYDGYVGVPIYVLNMNMVAYV